MEDYFTSLQIPYCKEFTPYLKEGENLYKKMENAILDVNRIITLNDEYKIFREHIRDVLAAAKLIEKNESLCVYIYALYELLKNKDEYRRIFPMMTQPDFGTAETDFAPLYALFFFAEDIIYDMENRNVPFEIISDTLSEFDGKITDFCDRNGRTGMRIYTNWFSLLATGDLIRIGRFNFQKTVFSDKIRVYEKDADYKILLDNVDVHKDGMLFGSGGQCDEEGKYHAAIEYMGDSISGYTVNEYGECNGEKITLAGYKEILSRDDKIISVHIPSHLPFDTEYVRRSLEDARNIFDTCYPEFEYKAIVCASWMMESRLKQIIGHESNITRFNDLFTTFPRVTSGIDGVSFFVFLTSSDVPPQQWRDDTSLQRAIKKHYLAGGRVYEKGGILL